MFVDKKREDTKHRKERCVTARKYRCKYRCMSCGSDSKYIKMQGTYTRRKHFVKNLGRWGKRLVGENVPAMPDRKGSG